MNDETEQMQREEQPYLDAVLRAIDRRLAGYSVSAEQSRQMAMERKRTMWRDLYEMDRRDMVAARDEINESIDQADRAEAGPAHQSARRAWPPASPD